MCACFWQLLFFLANSPLIYFPAAMSSLLEEVFQTQTVNSSYVFPNTSLAWPIRPIRCSFLRIWQFDRKRFGFYFFRQEYLNWIFPAVKLPFGSLSPNTWILVALKLAFLDFWTFFRAFYFIVSFCALKELCHFQQNKWRKMWTKYKTVPNERRNDEIRIKISPSICIQWIV